MDLISDSITKIRNAQKAGHDYVSVGDSKLIAAICRILKRNGYILAHNRVSDKKKKFREISLKYDEKGNGVIKEFVRISKTSRRVYCHADEIPRIANGYATVMITTSKGVLTGKQAKEGNVGGEVICYVL